MLDASGPIHAVQISIKFTATVSLRLCYMTALLQHKSVFFYALFRIYIARSCAEAGKTNCKRTATERCDVTTSQGTCYCDSDCEDCCEDAILLQKEGNCWP